MGLAQTKKHGLDMAHIDLNLEIRLRQIEKELVYRLKASTANATTDPNAIARLHNPEDQPDAPIGFSLVKTLKLITAKWDEATVPNLLHYEIHVAKDIGFASSVQTFNRKDTNLSFEADTDDTYYVKVRLITQDGINGKFTSTLNTSTGQAVTAQFEDNAITAEAGVTTTGTIAVDDDGVDVVVQTLTVTSTGIGAYIFFSCTQVPASAAALDHTISLERDGTELISFSHRISTDVPSLVCIATLDTPSAGARKYDLIVNNPAANSVDINVSNRSITVLEAKK